MYTRGEGQQEPGQDLGARAGQRADLPTQELPLSSSVGPPPA